MRAMPEVGVRAPMCETVSQVIDAVLVSIVCLIDRAQAAARPLPELRDVGRRLNIRLSSKDLARIQKRALAEGLPYQTLIASLLHKYATGRLKEV
jgi:hypothetical protein